MSSIYKKLHHDSGGDCIKCGNPLMADGTCYDCDSKSEKIEALRKELRDVFTCKICGQPKYHSRLHGYLCRNPEHNHHE